MRLFIAAAALSLLVGCVHPKPKPPAPQPTPTPEATMPGPGVPVAPEMLLRTDGAKLANGVEQVGAVPCCWPLTLNGVEVNTRWPLASEEWMDWTHSFGANTWHFRLGPWYGDAEHESEWKDIGGAYKPGGLEWNAAYWQKVRELAWHAYKLGGYVEVNAGDSWYCKVAQWGTQPVPWPAEDVAACGIRPSPEQERLWRKAVSELGCFGNVHWITDNEGDQIRGWKREWYEWVRNVIRDEEQKSGCGFVHLVGTNNPAVADGPFDYVATHDRAPLVAPIAGKFTIVNEHNPAMSPAEEAARFADARKAGLSWWYWRAEQTDAQALETLGLFRDVIQGGAQTGCYAAPPEDERWKPAPEPYNAGPVLGWLEQAKREVGDPKALPGATVWDRGLLALDLLGASLRRAGHCSSDRWRDALAVQGPDRKWYELHVIAFTDGGYAGQAFKGSVWSYQQ